MQTVTSVPVPIFQVPALTTGATSIVSRTKTRIPVNNSSIYGHVASNKNYTPRITFGNNESGFVPANTFLEFDFTPTWFDGIASTSMAQNSGSVLCPTFDQTVQSLIARLKISTPQGLVIDELHSYNMFANIVEMYLVDRQKKDMDIPRFSTYSKDVFKERGMGKFIDGWRDKAASPAALQNGVTRRIHIPLLHSTVMNRMKFIPSFVIRNGIEFELDFERPERAFVYETGMSPQNAKITLSPCAAATVNENSIAAAGVSTALEYNWLIGPGTHTANGTVPTVTAGISTIGADHAVIQAPAAIPNGTTRLATSTNYGFPFNWSLFKPFSKANPNVTYNGFSSCKNFLYLTKILATKMLDIANRSNGGQAITFANIAYGFPISLYRDGVVTWRGFTLIDPANLEYYYTTILNGAGANDLGPYAPVASARVFNRLGRQQDYTQGRFAFPGFATFQQNSPSTGISQNLQGWNGETGLTTASSMLAFPLYNWDHVQFFADNIPAFMFTNEIQGVSNEHNIYTDMGIDKNALCIDTDNMFVINGDQTPANAAVVYSSGTQNFADPRIMHIQHLISTGKSLINWDYTINNISLIVDWLKPSSDIFVQISKSFQMPTGIPYALTRVLHYNKDFDAQSTGQQQIVVPFQVRSLTSLVLVLTDPYFSTFGASQTKYFLPMLSSFQRRGLTRVEVTIGGARKPEYTLQLDKNGGFEHFPETSNAFGLSNATGFSQSFSREAINETRNYIVAGHYEQAMATTSLNWSGRQFPNKTVAPHLYVPTNRGVDYIDSSKFVIAIPLAKLDTNGFASGLDTTMSGNLNVTLYFSQDAAPTISNSSNDPGYDLKRPIRLDVWGTIDAVLTLQNDANTIRN